MLSSIFSAIRRYDHEKHKNYNNFLWLVLSQISVILLPAFAEFWDGDFFLQIAYTLVLLVSAYIVTFTQKDLKIAMALCSVSLLFVWVEYAAHNSVLHVVHLTSTLVFFTFCALKLWAYMYGQKKFSVNMLFGAVAGYLYIGFIGAMVLSLLEVFYVNSFRLSETPDFYDMLYLSFVTISTLGYGDFVPITKIAKATCILFAMAGQLYLTIILAIIVGQFLKDSSE